MECVGAVIALDNKTKHLDKKIESIEQSVKTISTPLAGAGVDKLLEVNAEARSSFSNSQQKK
jgi:hypothetical protein